MCLASHRRDAEDAEGHGEKTELSELIRDSMTNAFLLSFPRNPPVKPEGNSDKNERFARAYWIPAFAGMTWRRCE